MGSDIAQYTIEALVGRGGAGRVFLAYDSNIGREVAIKEVDVSRAKNSAARDRRVRRFLREAKITGQLEHPSVVPVYDFGTKPDGTNYYVMKYVRGRTLLEALRDSEADTSEEATYNRLRLVGCLIDVCEAMAYAHAKGIIHRDLKPGNIVLGEFGETIILDWGLAKKKAEEDDAIGDEAQLAKETGDDITRHGAILGTPSYMAPEQADMRFGTVDERSDVYALGAILFFILAGEKVYRAQGREAIAYLVTDEPTPSPAERNEGLPPELVAICEKATAKDKQVRFANAREMAEELKAYRDGRLVSVYAYSRGELFKRFLTRNVAAVVATAALIVSVVAGAGFSLNFAIDAHRAKQRAESALVEVSAISQKGMKLARDAVVKLEDAFDVLLKNMDGVVAYLERGGLGNVAGVSERLAALKKKHPRVDAFVVVDPDLNVIASAPAGYRGSLEKAIASEVEMKETCQRVERGLGGALMVGDAYTLPYVVPLFRGQRQIGVFAALIAVNAFMPSAFDFDPAASPFQVWCMQEDGKILYDEDPAQEGKYLFTDNMYTKFPELLQFGERMQHEPWGMGHYSFFERAGEKVIHKVALWDTLDLKGSNTLKLVVSHPYESK